MTGQPAAVLVAVLGEPAPALAAFHARWTAIALAAGGCPALCQFLRRRRVRRAAVLAPPKGTCSAPSQGVPT